MKIDRSKFFDGIRGTIHHGHLSQEQVESYDAILDAAEAYPITDIRQVAYILATARGEVGIGMQPVREIGKGKGRPYGKPESNGLTYYGRGFVQLTWGRNYEVIKRHAHLPNLQAVRKGVAADHFSHGIRQGSNLAQCIGNRTNASRREG